MNNENTDAEPTDPDALPSITFTTRGHGSRTLRLEMVTPGADRFTKSHATMFRVSPYPNTDETRPGYFMPATFRVYGLSTSDGGQLPVTFTIDRVVPVWESGPAREHVGIVDLHFGAVHDEAVWEKAEQVMLFQRTAAPWKVTTETLRAIPIQTLIENALTLAQCLVRVRPYPHHAQPDAVKEALKTEHTYRGDDNRAFLAVPIAPDTEHRDGAEVLAPRRRGKARGSTPGYKHPDVIAFAVKCYQAGMSVRDTRAEFENTRREWWKGPTIEAMWNEAQRQGLMTRDRRKRQNGDTQ